MVKKFWACKIVHGPELGFEVKTEFVTSFDGLKEAKRYIRMDEDLYPSSVWTIIEIWETEPVRSIVMALIQWEGGKVNIDTGKQTWVLTRSGRAFDLVDLDPNEVDIEDIAYSLGNLCRYTGHPEPFFSVAEHSVVMSRLVSRPARIHALVHDAPEAYVNDLATPVKLLFPDYKALENRVEVVIYEHFEIEPPNREILKEIKDADVRMHMTERVQLLPAPPKPWARNHPEGPFSYRLPCWGLKDAGPIYLGAFKQLRKEHIG